MTTQPMTASAAPAKASPDQEYSADSIQALEGLEAVRKRPGMYIGSTDSRGLQHCVWEIIDNAVDEAIAGHCTNIEVVLHADGSVEVRDDGRGIPVDINTKTGLSGVELIMTKLHAGGKFGGGSYGASGGLHGVGASVVNAVSTRLDCEVDRDGATHAISFHRGVPGLFSDDGTFAPRSGLRRTAKVAKGVTGTRVRYWADSEIFLATATLDIARTHERARQTAFLVPGLAITVADERGEDHSIERFCYLGGMADLVDFVASDRAICDTVVIKGEGSFTESVPVLDGDHMVTRDVERSMGVEVALRWGVGYDTDIRSFVNIIATTKGGTHVAGFERACNRVLNEALRSAKVLKDKDDAVIKEDVQEGLTAVVLVRLPEPQFEGQTKEILGTAAALSIVSQVVADGLKATFAEPKRRQQLKGVLDKVNQAAKTRKAMRLQKETIRRKNALESSAMPAKLADCRSDDMERSEILVVEGDSAMGCLLGDITISTVNGPRSFIELARDWDDGISHFGYASDAAGDVVVVPLVHPRMTRADAELVEVEITSEPGQPTSRVQCTPDHPFRLRDGSYRRADHLEPGDSLMPLRRRLHEVVAVCHLSERAEVYDLTVEVHHNFALDAGVFVHNSAKAGRDSEFQALLPIRGKILNVQRATEKQMLDNNECAAIITAMGAGSGRSFDLSAIRYGKLIILADADVDGSHIRCLILTLAFRYMRPLLEAGRVYAAMPPLHRIAVARTGEHHYTFTDEQRLAKVAELTAAGKTIKDIQRYKGLGEMDADQLAETTLDPSARSLRRLTMLDAEAAISDFEMLMGQNVADRRDFIIANSTLIDRDQLDV